MEGLSPKRTWKMQVCGILSHSLNERRVYFFFLYLFIHLLFSFVCLFTYWLLYLSVFFKSMHFLIFAYPTVNYTFFGQTQTQTCQTSDTSRARQDVLISGIRGFFLTGNDLDHVEVRFFLAENFLVSFLFVEFCFLFGEFLRPQKLLWILGPQKPACPVFRSHVVAFTTLTWDECVRGWVFTDSRDPWDENHHFDPFCILRTSFPANPRLVANCLEDFLPPT